MLADSMVSLYSMYMPACSMQAYLLLIPSHQTSRSTIHKNIQAGEPCSACFWPLCSRVRISVVCVQANNLFIRFNGI